MRCNRNSRIYAIHAVRQFIYTRCRQSRRIKINRADDIRPYGQYITFLYSIVGGSASTPRKNFPLSTFIFQLSIDNRSSEGMVIASRESGVAIRTPKAPLCKGSWHGEAVTEGLLRGALHRKKTDSHGCCAASE